MKYLNVFIANDSKLFLEQNHIVIDNGTINKLYIEDIKSIVIENKFTTLSAALISKLGKYDVSIIVCDDQHLPTSIFLPCNQHSRQRNHLKLQLKSTQPFNKNLWKQIVIQKVRNQASALRLAGKEENVHKLLNLCSKVKSGDIGNIEAVAARIYFRSLFGEKFKRGIDDFQNAALNFGYSIFRSQIAKTLASYGFEPSIGLHHKSELNNFNLADDFIEPFRPLVDIFVFKELKSDSELKSSDKARLLTLLSYNLKVEEKSQESDYAIQLLIESYLRCLENRAKTLKMPALEKLELNSYE